MGDFDGAVERARESAMRLRNEQAGDRQRAEMLRSNAISRAKQQAETACREAVDALIKQDAPTVAIVELVPAGWVRPAKARIRGILWRASNRQLGLLSSGDLVQLRWHNPFWYRLDRWGATTTDGELVRWSDAWSGSSVGYRHSDDALREPLRLTKLVSEINSFGDPGLVASADGEPLVSNWRGDHERDSAKDQAVGLGAVLLDIINESFRLR